MLPEEPKQSAKKKDTPISPTDTKKQSKNKKRIIWLVSIGAALLVAGAVILIVVLNLTAVPLKEYHQGAVNVDGQTSLQSSMKVPEGFEETDASFSGSELKDKENQKATIQVSYSNATYGGVTAMKENVDEIIDAIKNDGASADGAQQICSGIINSSSRIWSVSVAPYKEYTHNGAAALSGRATCVATEDYDDTVKKGDAFKVSYFITDYKIGTDTTQDVAVGILISAPVDHRVHKVDQRIFDSLTITKK